MVLSSTRVNHDRRIYGWLDLLGDMGGVQGALCVCLEFMLLPIAHHCYILAVMKRLFLGQTRDKSLFKTQKKNKKKLTVDKDDKNATKIEKNRPIKLSLKDNFLLYISNTFGCLFCNLWPKKKKLQKLYDVGSEKIEVHLDIIKIVKSLKKLKIFMEN